MIRIHFFLKQKQIADRTVARAPHVGDELRMSATVFYRVVRRVWCYDEDKSYDRCNIELEDVS